VRYIDGEYRTYIEVLELRCAGIASEIIDKGQRNVVVGHLGNVELTRGSGYWIAEGKVAIEVANLIYADSIGRQDVRAAGHCGRVDPMTWARWFLDDKHIIIDKSGTRKPDEDNLVVRSVHELPAGATGYIYTYHIDSIDGLALFAKLLREAGYA
jgi:hypothetical protein